MVSAFNARITNSRRLSRIIPKVFCSLTSSDTPEHEKVLVLALVSLCSNCLAHRHSQLCFHRLFPRFFLGRGKVGRCLPGLFLEQWEGGAVTQQRPWDACFHSTPKSSSQGNQSGIQAQTLFGCCSLAIWNPVIFIHIFPSPLPLSWAFLQRWNCVSKRYLLENLFIDDLKGLLHPK